MRIINVKFFKKIFGTPRVLVLILTISCTIVWTVRACRVAYVFRPRGQPGLVWPAVIKNTKNSVYNIPSTFWFYFRSIINIKSVLMTDDEYTTVCNWFYFLCVFPPAQYLHWVNARVRYIITWSLYIYIYIRVIVHNRRVSFFQFDSDTARTVRVIFISRFRRWHRVSVYPIQVLWFLRVVEEEKKRTSSTT